MNQPGHVHQIIRERAITRAAREREQRGLWQEDDDFHETVRSKLEGLWHAPQFTNFSRCGLDDFYRTCRDCGEVQKLKYQCSIKWCPRCQWRITRERTKLIEFWARHIDQPKHLVLTQKNFPVLTRARLRTFVKNLAALRRRKIFRPVKGGTCSIEITNEGNGWHLHAHLLLDVRWLDMRTVARVWGKQVGQLFAIVKIKDVSQREYLKEVSKYVVEGSELAKWPAEQINEFVRAVKGCRFFGSFGSMRELAPQIRAHLRALRAPAPACDCGCSNFIYEDEVSSIMRDHQKSAGKMSQRNPKQVRSLNAVSKSTSPQTDFALSS
jgi:Replication protein